MAGSPPEEAPDEGPEESPRDASAPAEGPEVDEATTPRVPARPLAETLAVFAACAAGTAVITYAPQLLTGLGSYVHLLVAVLFLGSAIKLAQREPGGMRRHGIDLAGMLTPPDADDERPAGPLGAYDLGRAIRGALPSALRESAVAIGVAAVIFPPFVVGFYLWHQPSRAFEFSLPPEAWSFALTQVLIVALPEEALFRGTFQTRLHDRWPPTRRFGVLLDPRAWLLSAALFALVHFVSIPNPARLAVFFPGLLFGLLRAWRGGIGAAMLLHAMSNVLAEILERGWIR